MGDCAMMGYDQVYNIFLTPVHFLKKNKNTQWQKKLIN